jgi:hypothetical protein
MLAGLYHGAWGLPKGGDSAELEEMFDRFKEVEIALTLAAGELNTSGLELRYITPGELRPRIRVRISKMLRQKIDGFANLIRRTPSSSKEDIFGRAQELLEKIRSVPPRPVYNLGKGQNPKGVHEHGNHQF